MRVLLAPSLQGCMEREAKTEAENTSSPRGQSSALFPRMSASLSRSLIPTLSSRAAVEVGGVLRGLKLF